jgi:DNA-binding transcriptional LysR family regulator
VKGNVVVNNAETLYELALLGMGLIRLADSDRGPGHPQRPPGGRARRRTSARATAAACGVHAGAAAAAPKVDAVIQFLREKFASVPWRLPHHGEKLSP